MDLNCFNGLNEIEQGREKFYNKLSQRIKQSSVLQRIKLLINQRAVIWKIYEMFINQYEYFNIAIDQIKLFNYYIISVRQALYIK